MRIQHSSTKSCSATLSGPSNACLALKDGRETSLGPLTVQKKKYFRQQKMIPSGSFRVKCWPNSQGHLDLRSFCVEFNGQNRKSSDATVCKVLRNY